MFLQKKFYHLFIRERRQRHSCSTSTVFTCHFALKYITSFMHLARSSRAASLRCLEALHRLGYRISPPHGHTRDTPIPAPGQEESPCCRAGLPQPREMLQNAKVFMRHHHKLADGFCTRQCDPLVLLQYPKPPDTTLGYNQRQKQSCIIARSPTAASITHSNHGFIK